MNKTERINLQIPWGEQGNVKVKERGRKHFSTAFGYVSNMNIV